MLNQEYQKIITKLCNYISKNSGEKFVNEFYITKEEVEVISQIEKKEFYFGEKYLGLIILEKPVI